MIDRIGDTLSSLQAMSKASAALLGVHVHVGGGGGGVGGGVQRGGANH